MTTVWVAGQRPTLRTHASDLAAALTYHIRFRLIGSR